MTDVDGSLGILKGKLLALIGEFAPRGQERVLTKQAAIAAGHIDFQAWLNGNLIATVSLNGEGIDFVSDYGIHGRLYPEFGLDDRSLKTTQTGAAIDVAAALRTLRVSFREADEVRILEDRDGPDEETFVVDPDTEADLIESHHT